MHTSHHELIAFGVSAPLNAPHGSIIDGKRHFNDDADDSHCAIDLIIFYVSAVLYAPFCAYLKPGVHMYGVPVLLLIPHGLVVDADCTTSMMMPTTEWCD